MSTLSDAVGDHLDALASKGFATSTLRARRYHLASFVSFCSDRDVTSPAQVTPAVLTSYQRHLYAHRKRDGTRLSFRTQAQRLIPVKAFFAWATGAGLVALDPSVGLTLPKTEHRLPEAVLSAQEAEAVLAVPDTTTAAGLRDRAVLEVFYSSAVRRAELIGLRVGDVDFARGTLFVRQGKGRRDRHVPVGQRARRWIERYSEEARPLLCANRVTDTLFVAHGGAPLNANLLSQMVSACVAAGAPGKHGSCHLFRHSAATLMLEGGADVRYVAELLGHAKLETTVLYTRVSLQRLREVHAACHPAEAGGYRSE